MNDDDTIDISLPTTVDIGYSDPNFGSTITINTVLDNEDTLFSTYPDLESTYVKEKIGADLIQVLKKHIDE
jgi:hypothetical protein